MRACENCRHWDNSISSRDHEDSGRCTVDPPRILEHSKDGMGAWPFTEASDGCGKHEPAKAELAQEFVSIPTPQFKDFERALAPFLSAAVAVANNYQGDGDHADDELQLDVMDDAGQPVGISVAEFAELRDAWETVLGEGRS